MQATKYKDYFVLKLTTNYHATGDQRTLYYKWLVDVEEYPEDHLIKQNHILIHILF